MYDIVNKISVLNLPKEVYPNIPKFYTSFSDEAWFRYFGNMFEVQHESKQVSR